MEKFQTTIVINPDLWEKAKQLGQEEGRTRYKFIERLIQDEWNRKKREAL